MIGKPTGVGGGPVIPTAAAIPDDGVYYIDENGERVKLYIRREHLDKDMLKEERRVIQERLRAIPAEPTTAELLAWAREHWRAEHMDYSAERAVLEARLDEIRRALGD